MEYKYYLFIRTNIPKNLIIIILLKTAETTTRIECDIKRILTLLIIINKIFRLCAFRRVDRDPLDIYASIQRYNIFIRCVHNIVVYMRTIITSALIYPATALQQHPKNVKLRINY